MRAVVSSVWYGENAAARAMRTLLRPAERVFAALVNGRNRQYDRSHPVDVALPALSVGNLTVGGTGKTPVAAWCVARLRELGATPAIVIRGYGDDEWRVHSLLNPLAPVVVSPDRVAGIDAARGKGADCVVLDDAFQHRRAPRVADIVLLSADEWDDRVRLLPAGPYREPLASLQRATAAVITVKSASEEAVQRASKAIGLAAPAVPVAVMGLRAKTLVPVLSLGAPESQRSSDGVESPHAKQLPTSWIMGRRIVVASAIGNPAAFEAQLLALGARIVHAVRFPDHHAFSDSDARRIAALAEGADGVLCTLKDAVKLHALWPREGPPLWYVSQSVVVDRGAEALDRAFARVLAARTATRLSTPARPAQTRLHGH